ncbi:hypothetical protein LCGC14_1551590 [marine sediment metagenome]|uniref:Uncharacterized protein n=1 Tax=marine sediment metagenome TaxID=412755 RepID=A0A0F9LQW6_9ZZZZ
MIVSICYLINCICFSVVFYILMKTNRALKDKDIIIKAYRLHIDTRDEMIKSARAAISYLNNGDMEEYEKELRLLDANRLRMNAKVEKLMEELD